jgi:hypothetical protein
VVAEDDGLRSADALLRHAAAADARRAASLVGRLPTTTLLEVVVTQAEMAGDEGHRRTAGIDVVAELTRVAAEHQHLPPELGLDLAVVDPDGPPLVTGWELATVEPDELEAATLTLDVRAWHLVLVAFADTNARGSRPCRRVVAAAADGRLVAARLRLTAVAADLDLDAARHADADLGATSPTDHDLLGATVSADPADLGSDAPLALALAAALAAATPSVPPADPASG